MTGSIPVCVASRGSPGVVKRLSRPPGCRLQRHDRAARPAATAITAFDFADPASNTASWQGG